MSVIDQIHQEHIARRIRLGMVPGAPPRVMLAAPVVAEQETAPGPEILPKPIKPEPIFLPRTEWKAIIKECADKHGVTVAQITGETRIILVARARHEAAFRMATELDMSLPQIGRRLGNRDHTTALHSIRKYMETNPDSGAVMREAVKRRKALRLSLAKRARRMVLGGNTMAAIVESLPVSEDYVRRLVRQMKARAGGSFPHSSH